VTVRRVSGSNRFGTAAAVAKELPVPSTVYLTEGDHPHPARGWPDALSVGPLAATEGHPILLATKDSLPVETAKALEGLGTTGVSVAGGPGAISDAVIEQIEDLGIDVRRMAGSTRYGTSSVIARAAQQARMTSHRLFYASGANWPDALAAGAAIAVNGGTLLLTPPSDFLAASDVVRFTREHSREVADVTVLGGPNTVNDTVIAQIQASIGQGPPPPLPKNPIVGETLASYDFEVGGQGWQAGGFGPGQWQWRGPGDASANAWRIEPYTDETTAVLQSPAINHPGGTVRVTWRMMHNTEECCDFTTWSWSSDGVIFNGLGGIDSRNSSYPLFDTFTAEFVAPPGTIYLRFAVSSDQLVNGQGAAIDNVKVER
jgi:hypothetical protein